MRKSKVTDEHREEARLLRLAWDSRTEKVSQAVFGEQYEIGNQSAVGQFLRGDAPLSLKAARGFARGLGVGIDQFSPRLAAEAAAIAAAVTRQESDDGFVDVPRKKIGLSAGRGKEAHIEEDVGGLKFRADFLRSVGVRSGKAAIVYVDGRSMEPTIPDRAVVLVNGAQQDLRDRAIYALRIGDELFVKRLVKHSGRWLARSDNEDREGYPDIPLEGDDIEIIGRAVWMGTRL